MNIPLSARHLKRYREIGLLLWKYGRSDLVRQMGIDDAIDAPIEQARGPGEFSPEQLTDDLEAMGPVYVKVGQLLATRPDLLPEAYLKALGRLHDKVKPFAFAEVEQIVATELGVRLSKAFSVFDPKPVAAASLGQVHFAALRDGRPVVVKVQRPDIANAVTEELDALAQIAELVDQHTELGRRYRFRSMLEELRVTTQHELNYEREAQNLVTIGRNLAGFDCIRVPQPINDYSTRRVLTMEYIDGRKITSLGPLSKIELDGVALAEELFRAYLKQILVDGIFHADPHPGNVFVTGDGCIALLDLGMVGHTTPAIQENLLNILLAISEGKSEEAAAIAICLSQPSEDFDSAAFCRRIVHLLSLRHEEGPQQMGVGKTVLLITRIAAENGLLVPSEFTLLGKTLLQLDEVGRILNPVFGSTASVRRNVIEITSRRVRKSVSHGNILGSLLEMKDFMTGLPARLNKILDGVSNAELEVNVRVPETKLVMEGLQKIANRVTMGIILAALIVGASLLMRVRTAFEIFGYPGLAMLLFLAAAAGGFWLILSIFAQDRRSGKKAPR
jgi:predicted unusual protein kinase regulating ubiquinone biosynthesis (AarF/ABC1/UbiB family)